MALSIKRNVISLYIIQIISYILPLVTFPYLAHVLGPGGVGTIGVAQTIAQLTIIFVDFGFDFTSARKASIYSDDIDKLSRQYWVTMSAKSILAGMASIFIVTLAFTAFHDVRDRESVFLIIVALWGSVLTPGWLFQGLQRMAVVATAVVLVRVALLVPLFFYVTAPDDIVPAAFLQFCPTLISGVFLTAMTLGSGTVRWSKGLSRKHIWEELADAYHIFMSSVLTSVYMYANTLILRFMLGNVAAGYYVSADKLITPLRQLSMPPIQAMFPRVCRLYADGDYTKASKVIKDFSSYFLMAGILLFVGFELFGGWAIRIFLGTRFDRVVDILRVLVAVPAIIGIAATHVQLGIIASGNQAVLKRIYLFGALFHIVQAPLSIRYFGVVGAAWSVFLTEFAMTILICRSSHRIREGMRPDTGEAAGWDIERDQGKCAFDLVDVGAANPLRAERMPGRRILYSGFRWPQHDEDSGYHHVVASDVDYVDGEVLWAGRSAIGSRRRKINFLLTDLVTIMRAPRYRAVLLFYPEQTGYLSAPILRLLGKEVAYVVHLGEDYWLHRNDSLFLRLKRFNLRFVSKFITLTDQQKSVFEKRFPGKVRKIPHGAWCRTEDGAGVLSSGEPFRITVVGDTYRDYKLLAQIIEFFRDKYPAVVFDLVGMKYEKLGALGQADNVVCHGRLDKETYCAVIRSALFVMLPLEFATANNALLEGLKVGVPVICSNVEGVQEYLPQGDYVFDSIEDLADKFERRTRLTQEERAAEAAILTAYVRANYSWDVIRSQVASYCLSGTR